jgi:hypothetical protein
MVLQVLALMILAAERHVVVLERFVFRHMHAALPALDHFLAERSRPVGRVVMPATFTQQAFHDPPNQINQSRYDEQPYKPHKISPTLQERAATEYNQRSMEKRLVICE